MPRCPFAQWVPISGSSGSYLGGPFKIVHHTTEGSTAQGAMSAFRTNRSDPHFTVDATTIYQHIDTNVAARALKNLSGGVQTNRDSAIQIEVVGFAARSKNRSTLENVARLCRWIETTHNIPKVWPNGFPKTAVNGRDPGGHNRNGTNWDTKGGHYGHSHVPENDHWDPGYTRTEVAIIMGEALESLSVEEVAEEKVISNVPEEVSFEEASVQLEPIEVEIASIKLVTYPVLIALNEQGRGLTYVDIASERINSVVVQAAKPKKKEAWKICSVAIAEDEGRTILIANGGKPNTTVTVFIKVMEVYSLSQTASGCPNH